MKKKIIQKGYGQGREMVLRLHTQGKRENMTTRNSEIARKFAEGALKRTSKHMFIEGDTIYSYSYSYPIAKRGFLISDALKGIFLMNSNGYSRTTKRHKSLVYQALNKCATIIFLPNCDINNAYEQKEWNEKKIVEFEAKLTKARTRHSYYESGIKNFIKQNKLIDELIIPHTIAEKL